MLSNAADKITDLVLTKEMKKYVLYDYKRNLNFGKLLLCPPQTLSTLNIPGITRGSLAV